MLLVLDAPGAVKRGERQRPIAVAHLDDDAAPALVHAELSVRPASAQARDQTRLIGGELEVLRHESIVGPVAEFLTKIRSRSAKRTTRKT